MDVTQSELMVSTDLKYLKVKEEAEKKYTDAI